MPEFLERRYNSNARSFLSIISLVSYILIKVAVAVYTGGVVFKDVFDIEYIILFNTQVDFFWISAIGLVVLTGLYTVFRIGFTRAESTHAGQLGQMGCDQFGDYYCNCYRILYLFLVKLNKAL